MCIKNFALANLAWPVQDPDYMWWGWDLIYEMAGISFLRASVRSESLACLPRNTRRRIIVWGLNSIDLGRFWNDKDERNPQWFHSSLMPSICSHCSVLRGRKLLHYCFGKHVSSQRRKDGGTLFLESTVSTNMSKHVIPDGQGYLESVFDKEIPHCFPELHFLCTAWYSCKLIHILVFLWVSWREQRRCEKVTLHETC